jgi:hypothetical protein
MVEPITGKETYMITFAATKLQVAWVRSANAPRSTVVRAENANYRLTLSPAMAWRNRAGGIPDIIRDNEVCRLVAVGFAKLQSMSWQSAETRSAPCRVILRRLLNGRGRPEQRTLWAELLPCRHLPTAPTARVRTILGNRISAPVELGDNVLVCINGNKLEIQIDLSEEGYESQSGKSMVVGSTHGNIEFTNAVRPGLRVGVSVYAPRPHRR